MDMTIDSMALSHKINVTLPQVHTGKELSPFSKSSAVRNDCLPRLARDTRKESSTKDGRFLGTAGFCVAGGRRGATCSVSGMAWEKDFGCDGRRASGCCHRY
jgi:hypothetical protein